MQALVGIGPRLGQAGPKVVEPPGGNPRVIPFEGTEAFCHQVRRKEFRQRRGDRDGPRLLASKSHIGLHSRAHAGLNVRLVHHRLASQTDGLPKAKPGFDAPLSGPHSVMDKDASDPSPPHLVVGTIRQDGRVLDGDVALVVEPVRHPAADLLRRQSTPIHGNMERVLVVVRPAADITETAQELVAAPPSIALNFHALPPVASPEPLQQTSIASSTARAVRATPPSCSARAGSAAPQTSPGTGPRARAGR